MSDKENKDLKKIYDDIFGKGEETHFTKLSEVNGELPSDEREALKEVDWEGKKVLEVGCGTGLFAYEVVKRGANVWAVDYSEEAINIAKSNYQHPSLNFVCEDIKNVSGTYDVVVSLGTLEHLDEPFETLKSFGDRIVSGGSIVLTCPNWTNPRGHMLMTLLFLFDAPITLADIHYFSPLDFEKWARDLDMKLEWRTFDKSRACGLDLVRDFEKRIPNVLRDAGLPNKKENIEKFLIWIKSNISPLKHEGDWVGASALYHLKKQDEYDV